MSNRLEEIKNEYAKEKSYDNWTDFINDEAHWMVEKHMNEICEIFAKECCQASLEKASENTTMTFHDGFHKTNEPKKYYQIGADNLQINKESIVQESNIVIL